MTTARERSLEAPHRRLRGPSRLVELTAIAAYRGASAVMAAVPPAVTRPIVSTVLILSYLVWPRKRRWSNANFGHVLGTHPGDPAVRRLALRAYRAYARYIVELMRLPARRAATIAELEVNGLEEVLDAWRASGGPLIVAAGHIGNNEAVAAGLADRGLPISVIADDTSYPELFALLKRQRASWGVELIPWRNLRDIYGVLRRNEILALLVDWGYRPDGIPVRLFDAWTTLPAGPATLAAKTNGTIVPLYQRRTGHGRFRVELGAPIQVASAEPAELLRATQAVADALQAAVEAAPEQWYSFKPVWPLDAEQQGILEARAAAMRNGIARRATGRPDALT